MYFGGKNNRLCYACYINAPPLYFIMLTEKYLLKSPKGQLNIFSNQKGLLFCKDDLKELEKATLKESRLVCVKREERQEFLHPKASHK